MNQENELIINFLSQQPDKWVIETEIYSADLDENLILEHLKLVKLKVSEMVTVPPSLLFIARLVSKKRFENGWIIRFEIIRKAIQGGEPRIKIQSMSTKEGYHIPNMKASIDFFYVDRFDNLLTFERLEELIHKKRIHESRLNMNKLKEAFDQLMLDQKPVRDLVIAEGIAPEIGSPSEIEFTFEKDRLDPSYQEMSGVAKVVTDDPLCHLKPQGNGVDSGVNILGEILPPQPGISIELEKTEGIRVSEDGSDLFAEIDGIFFVHRTDHTVKGTNGIEIPRIQYQMSVESFRVVEGNEVKELDTDEHLEIRGDLSKDARITTGGKILVDGKIEPGCQIDSSQLIIAKGGMSEGAVWADGEFYADNEIQKMSVYSGDGLTVHSKVKKSEIVASRINIDEVQNSTLIVGKSLEIGSITDDTDSNGRITKIQFDNNEYCRRMIREAASSIRRANIQIHRIEKLVHFQVSKYVLQLPMNQLVLKYINFSKKRGNAPFNQEDMKNIHSLFNTCSLLMKMIENKRKIISRYREKLLSSGTKKAVIKIKEGVFAAVDLHYGNRLTRLREGPGARVISFNM